MDDELSRALGGFGPTGILAIVVILLAGNATLRNLPVVPVGGLLVLAWAQLSDTPLKALGYIRPRHWFGTLAYGFAFGIVFKLAMESLVMPVLGGEQVNGTYHYLAGNGAMLPAAAWSMLVAGFGEETVYRGFLFERCARLFGSGIAATAVTVVLTSLLFAAAHYPDQGWMGVKQAIMTGLVFGAIFANTGHIFFLMCAHTAFDLTAVAIIYLGLESETMHLFFR